MAKNYQIPLDDILKKYDVDKSKGLSQEQVQASRKKYGQNVLEESKGQSKWEILLENLNNIIVYLLGFAMILSGVMGDWIEAGAVFLALLISVLTGFFVELKAQKSVDALKDMVNTHVTVLRDGHETEIESSELVPGDIMVIGTGDAIAADGRLLSTNNLAVIESALTGESEAVDKDADAQLDEEVPVGDRLNMVFSGTAATRGQGLAIVTETGMKTEVGKISDLMSGEQQSETPLDREIEKLGKTLIGVAFVAAALVIIIGMLNGQGFSDILHIAIILAVAAIPEAMPAVQTITLSNGMKTMSKHRALVKTLSAVETLGSTSVIASDKTGTLTENQMMVESIITREDKHYHVTGSGYTPKGQVVKDDTALDLVLDKTFVETDYLTTNQEEKAQLQSLILNAFLSSNARLEQEENSGNYQIKGDPTDGALKVLGHKLGLKTKAAKKELGIKKHGEIPFESKNKYMAAFFELADGSYQFILKGAPDVVMGLLDLSADAKRFWEQKNTQITENGMRCIALATKSLPASAKEQLLDDMVAWLSKNSQDLHLQGLFGIVDPPRQDVAESIAQTQSAGITVKMITGDHPKTASMIAKEIGIKNWDKTMTGQEIDAEHGESGFIDRVNETAVFARVSPENKLQLVKALQKHGEVVAMTGDGVNDAPALNGSDIGVAMGIRGTEVAKEASDMILTDDRFSTIVEAVREGRIIFENIKKYVSFLFACNMVEIISILFTIVFFLPMPIQPLHILWLNLLIDIGPAIALAYEAAEDDVMTKPPRNPKSGLVNKKFLTEIILNGTVIGLGAFAVFYYFYVMKDFDLAHAQTATFTYMTIAQLLHIFNVRKTKQFGLEKTFFKNRLLLFAMGASLLLQVAAVYLPFFNQVLSTVPLAGSTLLIILGFALVITLVVYLIRKIYQKTED